MFVCLRLYSRRNCLEALLMAGRFKVLNISLVCDIETSTRGLLPTAKRNKNRWHRNQSYVLACVSGFYNNKPDGKEAVERAGSRAERQNVPNQFCVLPSPLWVKVKVPLSQRRSHIGGNQLLLRRAHTNTRNIHSHRIVPVTYYENSSFKGFR